MGLYLGKIKKLNSAKGYITLLLNNPVQIGDKISISDQNYHISEFMVNHQNRKSATKGEIVTLGRMKGNIEPGMPVYRLVSKSLSITAKQSYEKENKKIPLSLKITFQKNAPVQLEVRSLADGFYQDLALSFTSDIFPEEAIHAPITKEKIISQFSKTGNTPFQFVSFDVTLDENLFIPHIAKINELRREVLDKLQQMAIAQPSFEKENTYKNFLEMKEKNIFNKQQIHLPLKNPEISLLFNHLDNHANYRKLRGATRIYLPFRCFMEPKFHQSIIELANQFSIYLYLPTITKDFYLAKIEQNLSQIVTRFPISGILVSNIGQISLVNSLNLPIVANYTFNCFNSYTVEQLQKWNIRQFTISPELDKQSIEHFNPSLLAELIVYGKTPVMNMNYCLLGKSNQCIANCKQPCQKGSAVLKDELGFAFEVTTDIHTHTSTIYNSKITSIEPFLTNATYRIDILDETVDKINHIISTVQKKQKLSGAEYTNGNLNRFV